MSAVRVAGGHKFSTAAHRLKSKLIEEASKMQGDLRRVLETAVAEKEGLATVSVSRVINKSNERH